MEVVAPSRTRRVLVLLVLATASVALYAALPQDQRAQARGSESLFAATSLVAALLVLRGARLWPSNRSIAFFLLLVGVGALTFLVSDLSGSDGYQPAPTDLAFLVLLVPLVLALRDEFRAHLEARDRRESAIDIALISLSLAAVAYTLMRSVDADTVVSASTGVFALLAATTSHRLRRDRPVGPVRRATCCSSCRSRPRPSPRCGSAGNGPTGCSRTAPS